MSIIRTFVGALALVGAMAAQALPVVRVGGYMDLMQNAQGGIAGAMAQPGNAAAFGASFAQSGVVGAGGVTQSYLDGIDVFWSGLPFGSMTASDAALLTQWINAGGVVIVNNDRSYPNGFRQFDPLYANFGIAQQNVASPEAMLNITGGAHPIVDGPFGSVSAFLLADAAKFTVSGTTKALATWADGYVGAAIADRQAGRDGALIVLPDWEWTGVCFSCSASATTRTEAAQLAENAWAYAARLVSTAPNEAPEPGTALLAALGLLAVAASRRRA